MGSLGETFGDATDRRRLSVGTGLFLLGAAIAAPGLARVAADLYTLAGIADPAALRAGVGTAGVAVPLAFLALLRSVGGDDRLRRAGLAGASLAVTMAGLHVAAGSTAAPSLWLGLPYLVGLAVAVWAPVAAAAAAAQETAPRRLTRPIAVTTRRGTSGPAGGRRVPADGGTEDDGLRFPLDRDE